MPLAAYVEKRDCNTFYIGFQRWIMTSKDERFIIGQRILDTAKKKKISQGALAKRLGIKQTTVSAWGKVSGPPIEKIQLIAKILETDIEYLMTGLARDQVAKTNLADLTEEERNIVRMYRTLESPRQGEFIKYIMAFNYGELGKSE